MLRILVLDVQDLLKKNTRFICVTYDGVLNTVFSNPKYHCYLHQMGHG